MTLKGAAQVMRRSSQDELARQTKLLEHLQHIRATLIEVREELKKEDGEQIVDSVVDEMEAAEAPIQEPAKKEAPAKKRTKAELKPKVAEDIQEVVVEEPSSEEQPKRRAVRRKKKSDDETKELFPFYEQSLF